MSSEKNFKRDVETDVRLSPEALNSSLLKYIQEMGDDFAESLVEYLVDKHSAKIEEISPKTVKMNTIDRDTMYEIISLMDVNILHKALEFASKGYRSAKRKPIRIIDTSPRDTTRNEIALHPIKQTSFTMDNRDELMERLFHGVVGLDDVKKVLYDEIFCVFKDPKRAVSFGINMRPGLIFSGGPGNGKTFLAQTFCERAGFYCAIISAPSLLSMWIGETEKQIRDLFVEAEKKAPSVIFIDEIDAIMPKRERLGNAESAYVNQFLSLLDGIGNKQKPVAIIGTTNRVEELDAAIKRSGRLEQVIEFKNPTKVERKKQMELFIKEQSFECDIDLSTIAEQTDGMTRADIVKICERVSLNLFLENRRIINQEDINSQINSIKGSIVI